MADTPKKRATYEDVLNAPEHMVAEILDGELLLFPRPARPHSAASSALGEELGPPFKRGRGGPGGWLILDEPEFHFGEDVLVPDLAGWRRERMPTIPDVVGFELAPDWICEVLSPSTRVMDRNDKLPIYAREHVAHVWLVDPLAQTLEVLKLEADQWQLTATYRDDAVIRPEPFDAVELQLGLLWTR